MSMRLLIDSSEFWPALQKDIRESRDCVYIQTLSFEGDRAGKMLSDELLSSSAKDKRVLVDSFTKYVISDRGNQFEPAANRVVDGEFRRPGILKVRLARADWRAGTESLSERL